MRNEANEAGSRVTGGLRVWLMRNRTSTRLAFVLNAASMVLMAILSLWWARVLNRTLGKEVYGLFLAFIAVAQLGGLGDLGISGAVGVRMMQHLSRDEVELGRRLLANARAVFLGLGLLVMAGFIVLSPWLPGWLAFESVPGAGSLRVLFALGGLGAALVIVNGYFQNLNYIHGNVVWPIVPVLLFTQICFLGQWLLAKEGLPLWAQYSTHVLATALKMLCGLWMLKISHAWLGNLWPLRFEWAEVRQMASMSFWVYLCALGNLVYTTTDQILVNAGFGSGQVPAYRFNYRFCELAIAFLMTASFVSLPAITRRLMSADDVQRGHGRSGLERLQKLHAFGACAFAMLYLGINDMFIRIWQGPEFNVPLALQAAFAMNLAVTLAGDAAVQIRGRLDLGGIRLAGLAIGGTGLLNLVLSFLAMKSGSMVGIAAATVVAQSILILVMIRSACRRLGSPCRVWVLRGWLAPIGAVGACALFRHWLPPDRLVNILGFCVACLGLLGALALALDVDRRLFVDEWKRFRASFS